MWVFGARQRNHVKGAGMANEEMTAPAMLEAAARLVTRALGKLDTTEEPRCRECGLRRFANKEEARVYENLSPLPSRLRHAAAKLQGKDYSIGQEG